MKRDSTPKTGSKKKPAPLDASSTYQVEGRTFVVQPVFQETGETSLATLLLNLMRADATGNGNSPAAPVAEGTGGSPDPPAAPDKDKKPAGPGASGKPKAPAAPAGGKKPAVSGKGKRPAASTPKKPNRGGR